MSFNYDLDFEQVNFRLQPELYRTGIGEQGVLLVEPYKSEILAFWGFKSEIIASESSEQIYQMFLEYLELEDFVGADMARKFLQMGFTRAKRYANNKSGKKYTDSNQQNNTHKQLAYPYSSGSMNKPNLVIEQQIDVLTSEKAKCAEIFRIKWSLAQNNQKYKELAQLHHDKYDK